MDIVAIIAILVSGIIVGVLANLLTEPVRQWFVKKVDSSDAEQLHEYFTVLAEMFEKDTSYATSTERLPIKIKIAEVFIPLTLSSRNKSETFVSTIDELLQPSRRHTLLIGNAGSGKTFLSKYLVSMLVTHFDNQQILPLYIQPRHISFNAKLSLLEVISEYVENDLNLDISRYFLQSKLERGKCLIIVDGFDELVDINAASQLFDIFKNGFQDYPSARFLFTSRPKLDIEVLLANHCSAYDIGSFDRDDIYKFTNNMTGMISSILSGPDYLVSSRRLETQKMGFLRSIYSDRRISDLAKTPLFLSMLYANHFFTSSLPAKRTQLYEQYISSLFESRINIVEYKIAYNVLEEIAFIMHKDNKISSNYDNVLAVITKATGDLSVSKTGDMVLQVLLQNNIFINIRPGIYSFSHISFQEYFAARYLISHDADDDFIRDIIDDNWWHEIIQLYCGIIGDSTRMMIEILNSSSLGEIDKYLLASKCLAEASYVDRETYLNVIKKIARVFLLYSNNNNIIEDLISSAQKISDPSISVHILRAAKESTPASRLEALYIVRKIGLINDTVRKELYEFQLDVSSAIIGDQERVVGEVAAEILDQLTPRTRRIEGAA